MDIQPEILTLDTMTEKQSEVWLFKAADVLEDCMSRYTWTEQVLVKRLVARIREVAEYGTFEKKKHYVSELERMILEDQA